MYWVLSYSHRPPPTTPPLSAETILRKLTNNLFVTQRNPTPNVTQFYHLSLPFLTLHGVGCGWIFCGIISSPICFIDYNKNCLKHTCNVWIWILDKYYFEKLSSLFVISWHYPPQTQVTHMMILTANYKQWCLFTCMVSTYTQQQRGPM